MWIEKLTAMKQVCVAGKVRYWAVPEKIHTPPTEEISAIRRERGEKMVSDNHRRRKIVKWGGPYSYIRVLH